MESVWDRAKPIYLALLLALLTWLALRALAELTHVLLILFVSILFAAALTGPVARLERWRVPRAISVIGIYVVALALVVGTLWLVNPTDRDFVRTLLEKMWFRVGAYLRAKIIVMAIVGAITCLALRLIG